MFRLTPIVLLLAASSALAGPYIPAGDTALRQDIQRLSSHGVITGPISTWPLAWGPILQDIEAADKTNLPPALVDALVRVKQRANWETRTHEVTVNTEVGLSDNAPRIRSFQNTPRGRAEVSAGFSWTGETLSADVNVQYVDSGLDDEEVRFDNSMLGAMIGNWSIAASTQQRWWGPGWDGSLILSNNARPFPAVVIDRVFTDAFESKWLSWLGPWDFNVMFGQLEEERHIPNTQFFGMRFNFRPVPSLEIGLSRGAQWCGDGRPCGLDTFLDLLIGRDNTEGSGTGNDEPGNQLAGLDLRWTPAAFARSIGIYGQFIGEDEAGGLPSRYIGQLGIEWSGYLFGRWSTRLFGEYAGTAAEFYQPDKFYNYAYNHSIYRTGYRFRNASIGHGADNDSELFSAGILLVDAADTQWRALLRFGELNAGGPPDDRNTLTPTPLDIASIDIAHSRAFSFGVIEIGLGYESMDDNLADASVDEGRIYLQWRSTY